MKLAAPNGAAFLLVPSQAMPVDEVSDEAVEAAALVALGGFQLFLILIASIRPSIRCDRKASRIGRER